VDTREPAVPAGRAFPAHEREVSPSASMLLEHWPSTYGDLELLPDNGARFEVIDGNLEMTPPPVDDHAVAGDALADLLKAASPPELRVLSAAGVHEALPDTAQQFPVPDVLVVRRTAVAAHKRAFSTSDVVLAVEVVSPSTRTRDRVT
jgi:Uma2 family endonuclease